MKKHENSYKTLWGGAGMGMPGMGLDLRKNNCTWQQLKPPNLVPKALLWEQLLCLDGQRLGLMMVMMV